MSAPEEDGILTLEPLIEAVREGIEGAGWGLSGLQKTTSHQFEGRWEGESTRSAYLFFHSREVPESVSIDVYLDETSKGLTGNLALVVDLLELGALGDAQALLGSLSELSADGLEPSFRRPITLRFRLVDAADPASGAETEVRFKLGLPATAIAQGREAVRAVAADAVVAFEGILSEHRLREICDPS